MNDHKLNKRIIMEGTELLNMEIGSNAVAWKDYAHIVGRNTVLTRLVLEVVNELMSRCVQYSFNLPSSGTRISKKDFGTKSTFDDAVGDFNQHSTLAEQDAYTFISEHQSPLVELFKKPMYINRLSHCDYSQLTVNSTHVLQDIGGGIHAYAKINQYGETFIQDIHLVNDSDADTNLFCPQLTCFLERLKKTLSFRGAFLEVFVRSDSFTVTDVHYCGNTQFNDRFITRRISKFERLYGQLVEEFQGSIATPRYQSESGLANTKDTVLSRPANMVFNAWNPTGKIGSFYCKFNQLDLVVIQFKDGMVYTEYQDRESLTFDFPYPVKTSKPLRADYRVTMLENGQLLIY